MADEAWTTPPSPRPVRPAGQRILVAAIGAFVLGSGLAGWLGWRSGADYGHLFRPAKYIAGGSSAAGADGIAGGQRNFRLPGPNAADADRDQMALAGRIAAVEQRLDRIDLRVAMASGNASRAEALLVAFAVRRVIEHGAPLGYLADQLKLRFGNAQPNAVATIIAAAGNMVPLPQLAAQLEGLAPQLANAGQETLWNRVTRGLSDLFIVRRDRTVLSDADARFDDARKALSEGRIDDAIIDVGKLSNRPDAGRWRAVALRTRDVERALDLIDTTALLEPHQLRDGNGNPANPITP